MPIRHLRRPLAYRWCNWLFAGIAALSALNAHATVEVSISSDKPVAVVGDTFALTVNVRNLGTAPLTANVRIFQLVAGSSVQTGFAEFVSASPLACAVVSLNTADGPLNVLQCGIVGLAVSTSTQVVIQMRATTVARPGVFPIATVTGETQSDAVQVEVVADTITDSDSDGVSDFNENLAGTAPNNGGSTPGASEIDVLVLYSAGAAALYNGDPSTRINHLFTVTNAIFASSGVRANLRIAARQQVNADDAPDNTVTLGQMLGRQGAFADVDTRRAAATADLVLFFRPFVSGSTNCGFASVLAVGRRGDLIDPSDIASAFGVVSIDCRDRTTAHETGHIMGLGHDHRDVNSLGTFPFSRGYGVDNAFVDVMGVAPLYTGNVQEIDVFSDPDLQCLGQACGVDRNDVNVPADAAFSLDTTRFQVARFVAGSAAGIVLDLDANGAAEALTDGVLLVRTLFSFTGSTLTGGALAGNATRTDANAIIAYVNANASAFDVDENNDVAPLTDGVLAVRYLFGFRGNTLIDGAVGNGAAASSSAAIEANLAAITQ